MQKRVSNKKILAAINSRLSDKFPDTPEAKLMLSVIMQAVGELFLSKDLSVVEDAMYWLDGELYEAQICGVDPDVVRSTVRIFSINPAPRKWGPNSLTLLTDRVMKLLSNEKNKKVHLYYSPDEDNFKTRTEREGDDFDPIKKRLRGYCYIAGYGKGVERQLVTNQIRAIRRKDQIIKSAPPIDTVGQMVEAA